MSAKTHPFQKYVYVAYSYFLLLMGTNVVLSGLQGKLNWISAIFTIVFLAQFYFKHKLTNLISGIVLMLITIYFFLNALVNFKQASVAKTLEMFDYAIVAITGLGLVASIILIVSFYKLSFSED